MNESAGFSEAPVAPVAQGDAGGSATGRLDAADPAAIVAAAEIIAAGGLLAFPTETVYGLGARADDDAAVARIFAAKARPADHPLIVHVADRESARRFCAPGGWSDRAQALAEAFWPGPLTLIVARPDGVAAAAAGGLPTLGLRCPGHPVAKALLEACAARGVAGIAAPSANRFGRVSATRAEHVREEFGEGLPVLDGGPCAIGLESAIVDCSRAEPALLRPGMLSRTRIEAVLGARLADAGRDSPKVPGSLESHYAPRAKLRLMPPAALRDALEVVGGTVAGLAVYSRTAGLGAALDPRLVRQMPADAESAAFELFAALREFDAAEARLIWVEEPPETAAWDAVRDRLRRASA